MSGRKLILILLAVLLAACLAACSDTDPVNTNSDVPSGQTGHVHEYTSSVSVAPTCTENGVMFFKCSGCGESYEEPIPATGHDMYTVELVESKCVEEGRRVTACKNCDLRIEEVLPPAFENHDYKPAVVIESTCTSTGSITYACTRCGDAYKESISKLPHDFEATSDTSSVCRVCGQECTYPAELGFEGVKQIYEQMRLELIAQTNEEQLDNTDPLIGLMWEEYSTFIDSSDGRKGIYLYVRAEYMKEDDWRIIDRERIFPFGYAYDNGTWYIMDSFRYLIELDVD